MKEILVFTKKGIVIRFSLGDIPRQNRNGLGIRAVQLKEGDQVVSVKVIKTKKTK